MLSNFFNFYNGKDHIEYTFTPGNTLYNLHYKGNKRNVSLILFANDEEHVIKIFKEAVELMVKCSEEYYCISPRHTEDWIYHNYVKKSLNILEDIKENKNFSQKNAKLMLRSRFSHTNLKKLSNAYNIQ